MGVRLFCGHQKLTSDFTHQQIQVFLHFFLVLLPDVDRHFFPLGFPVELVVAEVLDAIFFLEIEVNCQQVFIVLSVKF